VLRRLLRLRQTFPKRFIENHRMRTNSGTPKSKKGAQACRGLRIRRHTMAVPVVAMLPNTWRLAAQALLHARACVAIARAFRVKAMNGRRLLTLEETKALAVLPDVVDRCREEEMRKPEVLASLDLLARRVIEKPGHKIAIQ
jgi:hypothetical protein